MGPAVKVVGVVNSVGTLTITNSEITSNNADNVGGVFNASGLLVMTNSTLSNNKTVFLGAALDNQNATATLTNCTISGNTSQNSQGGITNVAAGGVTSSLTLTNCTMTGNTSVAPFGAIYTLSIDNNSTAVTKLKNTLVANNTGANFLTTGPTAANATLFLLNNNLDGDGTSGVLNNFNGNIVGTANNKIDAKLGPLANNGGPTPTHLLLCGSPALDKGSNPDAPATDQRGIARPVNGTVDIGAVEANPSLTINPATFARRLCREALQSNAECDGRHSRLHLCGGHGFALGVDDLFGWHSLRACAWCRELHLQRAGD